MALLLLVYGLAFFVLGVSLLLYPWRSAGADVVRSLRTLGAFGVLHGASEWTQLLALESGPRAAALGSVHFALLVASFACLVEVGVTLRRADRARAPRFIVFGPLAGLACAAVALRWGTASGDALVRYALALGGGLFTAHALAVRAPALAAIADPLTTRRIRRAAAALAAYSLAAGMVVRPASFFPASVVNTSTFLHVTGMPIQLVRALCAAVLTFTVLRAFTNVEEVRALDLQRASLEKLVAERTAAVEASRAALEAAYRALETNQAALLQNEKMAAVGRLTAGFAHELSSPLGAVLASAEELSELADELERSIGDAEVTDDDLREIAKEIDVVATLVAKAAQRGANFVRSIRAHTRDAGDRDRVRFDVTSVVSEAVQLIAHSARASRASVHVEPPKEPVEVFGVPSRLSQVVVNIAGNAIDAVGERGGGNVHLSIEDADDEVRLRIADDGPGIRPSVLPRIFEPLFTTKPHGRGSGLGLAIVDDIVRKEFHGTIGVQSTKGEGTAFTLTLPK